MYRDSGGEDYNKRGVSRNDMKQLAIDWKICKCFLDHLYYSAARR
jgi:hypothetical protein